MGWFERKLKKLGYIPQSKVETLVQEKVQKGVQDGIQQYFNDIISKEGKDFSTALARHVRAELNSGGAQADVRSLAMKYIVDERKKAIDAYEPRVLFLQEKRYGGEINTLNEFKDVEKYQKIKSGAQRHTLKISAGVYYYKSFSWDAGDSSSKNFSAAHGVFMYDLKNILLDEIKPLAKGLDASLVVVDLFDRDYAQLAASEACSFTGILNYTLYKDKIPPRKS